MQNSPAVIRVWRITIKALLSLTMSFSLIGWWLVKGITELRLEADNPAA